MILDIRFDFDRTNRLGFVEAIWGEHKTLEQLKRISELLLQRNEVVFITRIDPIKANSLKDIYQKAIFFKEAQCLVIGENINKIKSKKKSRDRFRRIK